MSEQPRYFLDRADKIQIGSISADKIEYDWDLYAFVFKNVPFTAEERFQRARRLIASLENDISTGKLGGHAAK